MKRGDLLRYPERCGCRLDHEGSRHTLCGYNHYESAANLTVV